MMREREDELTHIENEHKVESVQERFPNDDLQLQDSQRVSDALTKAASHSYSIQ